jgi:hypothetical protein
MLYKHMMKLDFSLMCLELGGAGLATGPGTADESKEADFASALQKIVVSATDIGLSEGTRTVTITVCGVTSDNDLQRYSLSTAPFFFLLFFLCESIILIAQHQRCTHLEMVSGCCLLGAQIDH